ncbi:MAG TPA: lipocalin-like domain-containing protein [Ohtaekwangia sp.]|uniref:lipocalin-like domain-containing protein n=1 Tax=Ohtaekwangia sp. TaxID=2066019 RepID=UPI002F926BFB
MKRLITCMLLIGSITFLHAQKKEEASKGKKASASKDIAAHSLTGTWTLVLVDNILSDGSRVELYGPSPQGILVFDQHGNYTLQIFRTGRAKFAANDKAQGTPEEYKAAVQGSNAHFGKYTVNETDGTITFHIEHASYPNWEGTEQKRTFTLINNELKYTVPTPTTGGSATGEVVWKRVQ